MPRKLTTLNGKKALIVGQGPRSEVLAKKYGFSYIFFLKKAVLRRMQAVLNLLSLCNGYNPLC